MSEPSDALKPETPSQAEFEDHLAQGCTFGIPPERCGQPPVYCEASAWPFLLFCQQHSKLAKNAFVKLLKLPHERR